MNLTRPARTTLKDYPQQFLCLPKNFKICFLQSLWVLTGVFLKESTVQGIETLVTLGAVDFGSWGAWKPFCWEVVSVLCMIWEAGLLEDPEGTLP